jgi:hypothetical protein
MALLSSATGWSVGVAAARTGWRSVQAAHASLLLTW